MSVLRIYTPAECEADGVPLGWERCDDCEGAGTQTIPGWLLAGEDHSRVCPHCGGHGSLKAAALSMCSTRAWARLNRPEHDALVEAIEAMPPEPGTGAHAASMLVCRCEDCGHPMSEGTWVAPDAEVPRLDSAGLLTAVALQALRQRVPDWENGLAAVHYSPCDEGCRHNADHTRMRPEVTAAADALPGGAAIGFGADTFEASWRPVDVRCLSWPHDLRPEMLAVLCLRCFAERRR